MKKRAKSTKVRDSNAKKQATNDERDKNRRRQDDKIKEEVILTENSNYQEKMHVEPAVYPAVAGGAAVETPAVAGCLLSMMPLHTARRCKTPPCVPTTISGGGVTPRTRGSCR